MDLDDYLRDLALVYRQLAASAQGPDVRDDYLDLARVCEEVANEVEERMTSG